MAGTTGARRGPIVGINVTPMVDVVLVLLVIMMVSATYIVAQSLKVELPKTATSDDAAPETANVTLTKEGKTLFNEDEVTEAVLLEKLHAVHEKNPDLSLVVSADQDVHHGAVVHIIDVAKVEGISKFAIHVERSEIAIMTRAGIIYLASFGLHGALAVGVVSLREPKHYDDVAISMVETKKKDKPKELPPEPPPPPPMHDAPQLTKVKAAPAAKAQEVAAPTTEAAPAGDGTPDFGLSLGNSGGPGLAVRAGGPVASASAAAAPPPVHKVLAAVPAAAKCDEPAKKPKPISISQPSYTPEARTANVAGKVRVEMTVDEAGKVVSARVIEGLGYGLDEAALTAARAATFEPGTLCGKPAVTKFTIAMRFTL